MKDYDYYLEIYKNNKGFNAYIKRYRRKNLMTIQECLKNKVIQSIAESYEPGGCNYKKEYRE